jgi:hypothetical protein
MGAMVSSLLESIPRILRISEGVLAASSLLYPLVGVALEMVLVEFKDLALICFFLQRFYWVSAQVGFEKLRFAVCTIFRVRDTAKTGDVQMATTFFEEPFLVLLRVNKLNISNCCYPLLTLPLYRNYYVSCQKGCVMGLCDTKSA